MKTFRPLYMFFLVVMMFSFSSCEMLEDVLPMPGTEEPEPEPETPSPLEMLVTDESTTGLVWQLQEVHLDGRDYTAQYDQAFNLENSHLDIRSDGTFGGKLLNENYDASPEPLYWQAEGQVLTLKHDYLVQALTPTQLVLERTLPTDEGWPGEVVTYVFVKE